jgi:hypothetical protein
MGTIEITTEPHELIVDGELICLMQADPSAGPEWEKLLTTSYAIGNNGRKELIEALAALGQTPDDTEALIKADPGGKTVNTLVDRYVEAVTGFPVGRPPTSTGRSKGTSAT